MSSSPGAVARLKALVSASASSSTSATAKVLDDQFSKEPENFSESARQGKQMGSGGVASPLMSRVGLVEVMVTMDVYADGVCGGKIGDARFCCEENCATKRHTRKWKFDETISNSVRFFITSSPTQGSDATTLVAPSIARDKLRDLTLAYARAGSQTAVDWQLWIDAMNDPLSPQNALSERKMDAAIASADVAMATPRVFRRAPLKVEDESPSDWVSVPDVSFPSGQVSTAAAASIKTRVEQAVPLLAEGVKQLQEAAMEQARQGLVNRTEVDNELDGFDIRVGRLERIVGPRPAGMEQLLWLALNRQIMAGDRQQEEMVALREELRALKERQARFEANPFAMDQVKHSLFNQVIHLLEDGGVMASLKACQDFVASHQQDRFAAPPLGASSSVAAQIATAVSSATTKIMRDVNVLVEQARGLGGASETMHSALALAGEVAALKARVEHCEEAGSSTQVVFDNITFASLLKTLEVVNQFKITTKHMALLVDPFSLLQLAYSSNADPTSVLGNAANARKAGFANSFQAIVIASLNLPLPLVYGGTEKEQSALGSHKFLLLGLTSWEAWNGTARITSKRIKLADRISQMTKALHGHIRLSDMSSEAKRLAQEMLSQADSFLTQFFTFKLNFMSEMGETKESWELLAGMIHQMWTDFHKVRAEAALVNYEADDDEHSSHVACYLWSMLQSHQVARGYVDKDFRNHPSVSSVMTIHLIENCVSTLKFTEVTQKLEKDNQYAVRTANEAKKLAEKSQSRGN